MSKLGVYAALAAAVLCACQQAPQPPAPVAHLEGAYTFTERLAAQGNVDATSIIGEIDFLKDTTLMQTSNGSCRLRPPTDLIAERLRMNFDCPDFGATVDLRNPLNNSRYVMVSQTVVNKKVCVQWGVDAKGNPICIQTGIVATPTSISRSGYLHFHALKAEVGSR